MSNSFKAAILMAALSLLATAARSDGISKAFNDTLFGGVSVKLTPGGGGGGGCSGVVDASAGCPLPMLGS